ncbi:IS1096 element passenger TnpR family protein [Propionivibrio sp.]|uniref:IS1096 element passenger TnpR family protein n=1 Tax=Propionivibrio sp. TaxID=2212460 RepID=UPI003BF2BA59
MILTLKVTLLSGSYANGPWEGMIEIDSSSTLDELHLAIQKAVNFDNDHMYEFYISRTARSGNRVRFDDENGEVFSTAIEDLYPLPDKKSLYYFFDFGDNWLFKITKSRKRDQEPCQGIEYPRLVLETGVKPDQYPDWEE